MENHLSWSKGAAFGSGMPWTSSPTITHDALAKFTQHFHATGRAENRSFAVLYAGEKAVFLACIGFVSVGGDVLRRPVNGHLSSAPRKRRGDRFYSSARLQKLFHPFHAGEIAGMLPNGIQQAAFPGIPLIVRRLGHPERSRRGGRRFLEQHYKKPAESKFPQLRRSRTAETKGCLHPEGIS